FLLYLVFLFTHPSPTEIYTLSLHDALPISFFIGLDPTCVEFRFMQRLGHVRLNSFGVIRCRRCFRLAVGLYWPRPQQSLIEQVLDRKSTRLNSSHDQISYAVFCLKKKNNT